MSIKSQIKITEADLKTIYKEDYALFADKIITSCYCGACEPKYNSIITNYEIFLNDLDDIILRGFCLKCQNPINRYIEAGEVTKYLLRIKKVKMKYLG